MIKELQRWITLSGLQRTIHIVPPGFQINPSGTLQATLDILEEMKKLPRHLLSDFKMLFLISLYKILYMEELVLKGQSEETWEKKYMATCMAPVWEEICKTATCSK